MKSFQAVLLIVFGALALLSVFLFATFSGSGGAQAGEVEIWGTLSEEVLDDVLVSLRRGNDGFDDVSYRALPEESFVVSLVEAIAAGRGPDLVIISSDAVVAEAEKLTPISFRSLSRRDFQDTFIEAGEVLLTDGGILGLPFYVDPFMLFWNRTMFSEAGVARAPRFWDEFSEIAPRLSKASESGTLTQSAVALGEWDNVRHAKHILASLIRGLGNDIVRVNDAGQFEAVLGERGEASVPPAESALLFYTDFADPVRTVYSWNRSQPESRAAFSGGLLGVYLGSASEVVSVRAANPNLNFDIAAYPRVRDGRIATPANLYALSIPRGSGNPQGALAVATLLAGPESQTTLMSLTGLPSVRRDLLANDPGNPYSALFRDAALNAYTLYDPDAEALDAIFERMVEDVSSGRLRIPEAVRSGQTELDALLKVQ